MAKRRTIDKDPLSGAMTETVYSAEIVPMPMANTMAAIDGAKPVATSPETVRPVPIMAVDDMGRRAVGGRLEILGGDLGSGSRVIWPQGPGGRIGFAAPSGRFVDLGGELDEAQAWPDRTEHRLLGAVGWAWVLASLGGIVGILAGGGLRLLEPRRMIAKMSLSDGAQLVVRTDAVTVSGLKAIAEARAKA
jgi:hypothetical protein